VAQRSPGRSTEDTDQEGVAPIRIADFAKSTSWLVDEDADKDPKRIKCANELLSDYKWNLKTTLTTSENRTYKEFLDAMCYQLSQPYLTSTKSKIYIKADKEMVENIAKCFTCRSP
jgi:hypothetical protein